MSEADLTNQLVYAFAPFSRWTSKANDAFIRLLEGQVSKAALFTGELANRSSRTRQELDERIQKLARLQSQGVLSLEEFNAAVEVPKRLLKEEEMQMEQIQTKDLSTFKVYAEIIQLFRKAYEFMQLPGFELEKIRLAKLVLSNSTLTDKTMRFTYKKPLDDLFALTDTNLKYDSPQSFGI